jgi:hypothetical protein
MKPRVYTDTSVLGGCEDEEFAEHSVRLLERFIKGDLVLVLSGLTVQELVAAPPEVRERLAPVPEAHIETLRLDAQAKTLAEAYVARACSQIECWPTLNISPSRRWAASTFW